MRTPTSAALLALAVCLATWVAAKDIEAENLNIQAEIPKNGTNIGFGHGALWVAAGFSTFRIDADDHGVVEVPLEGASQKQRRLLIGPSSVWIADVGANKIFGINPDSLEVTHAFPAEMLSTNGSIAVGDGSVWVVTADNFERTLTRFESATGETRAKIELPSTGFGVVYAVGGIWVSSSMKDEIYRVNPQEDTIDQTIATGSSPRLMVEAEGSVWVHTQGDGNVQRIDGQTGEIMTTIETGLPLGAGEIVASDRGISLSTPYQVQFLQIDPGTNSVALRVSGNLGADDHAVGDGSLWLGHAKIRRATMP